MMELAQKLFFHSLANNRAALALMLDGAEEQDVKMDLVTLHVCAGAVLGPDDVAARRGTSTR